MNEVFRKFAQVTARASGHAGTFVLAAFIVLIWLLAGPLFAFSNTWQLVINTGTTIVTFLMVFVLQNTQNRDNQALQLKLDELLRAVRHARTSFVDIEEVPDEELEAIADEFRRMHETAQSERANRSKRKA